ncbi:Putative ATP-dependent RNA helicase DDX12 [Frankliniella fusca]|uniref:ATP-dependent RNA helicase DDX12 n=1 Tax=Frankliniella fusca TaxID=407009 RepID=A0AAE1H9J6_9NEOP|nr:Putative ATP-dependent RNA helicase DDX12 [Frankliniella fusca]
MLRNENASLHTLQLSARNAIDARNLPLHSPRNETICIDAVMEAARGPDPEEDPEWDPDERRQRVPDDAAVGA